MDPDEIARKAQAARLKMKKSSSQGRKKPSTAFKPQSPESWAIFRRIFPMNYFFESLLTSFLLLTGLFAYFYFDDEKVWQLYIAIISFALFVATFLVYVLIRLRKFYLYKTWRKNLSFKLVGWDKLGQSKKLIKDRKWTSPASLEVKLVEHTGADHRQLVVDALYLFSKKTVMRYGLRKEHSYGTEWIFESPTKVSGTAYREVMGEMQQLMKGPLSSIQLKYPCIEVVEIIF